MTDPITRAGALAAQAPMYGPLSNRLAATLLEFAEALKAIAACAWLPVCGKCAHCKAIELLRKFEGGE